MHKCIINSYKTRIGNVLLFYFSDSRPDTRGKLHTAVFYYIYTLIHYYIIIYCTVRVEQQNNKKKNQIITYYIPQCIILYIVRVRCIMRVHGFRTTGTAIKSPKINYGNISIHILNQFIFLFFSVPYIDKAGNN